jgi:tRNA pseudouridine55 synthase
MKHSPCHGFLVIDKPGGLTSRDVVDRAQRWFPRGTRLGHTGTLDPLATGVLALAVGVGTRLTELVQQMDKTYDAGLFLGARSDTDDADGTITPVEVAAPPERAALARALEAFVGEIEQVPPAYSAAKVTGRRAYDLARRGQEVLLQPRRVRVYGIDLLTYDYPRLEIRVRCGKGTYIRSIARDLGGRVGSGALIERLRRTRVGPFRVEDALSLDADSATVRARLLPLAAAAADLPQLTVDAASVERLRRGQMISLEEPLTEPEVAILDGAGTLVAIATADGESRLVRPVKVLQV